LFIGLEKIIIIIIIIIIIKINLFSANHITINYKRVRQNSVKSCPRLNEVAAGDSIKFYYQ